MIKGKNIKRIKDMRKYMKKKSGKAKQKIHPVKKEEQSVDLINNAKLSEPEHKLVLEYIIHASTDLLFDFLTTPSGLSEWFADDVNVNGDVYIFVWNGAKQQADVISKRELKSIRFHWTDRAANTYFEFRIEKNELTEELSLCITDFAESAEEKDSLELFWQGQMHLLTRVLGSVV